MANASPGRRTDEAPSGGRALTIWPVIERHFDELQSLMSQRLEIVDSPELTRHDLQDWDGRIDAHLDALILEGDALIPFLQEQLSANSSAACASASVLLRLEREPAAQAVADALRTAEGEPLAGLRTACCLSPIALIAESLRDTVATGPPAVSAAAALALACHQQLDSRRDQWRRCLGDEDAEVRQVAWSIMALVNE